MPNYQAMAVAAAQRYGVPTQVFLNQIGAESNFRPNAVSSAGAKGIAQFEPATAAAMGIDPMNPQQALLGAAKLDAQNIQKYGSVARALSAYNSGRPDAYLNPNFAHGETYNYVKKILGGTASKAATPTAPVAATSMQAGGANTAQQALAQMMLAQSSATASGQPANPASSLLNMAMARQQLGAAQQVFGNPNAIKSSVTLSNGVQVKGVNPTSPHDVAAVKAAEAYVGTPYVWGGASPKGFDCSGLLQYVWGKQGVTIPRTTYDQFQTGKPVSQAQLRAGDAVFFKGSDSKTVNGQVLPGHVGMYIGNGKFVEAPHTGASVEISNLAGRTDYMGARRYA